jgi:hypothetical protein
VALTKSPVERVNLELAKQGREERVIRARGYYMIDRGEAIHLQESGLYGLGGRMLQRTEADYRLLAGAVQDKLKELGINVTLN